MQPAAQIAQLEKDRDVAAQVQAITALGSLPRPTFAAMNALHNCMADSRVSALTSFSNRYLGLYERRALLLEA
jgi:hypothetical protein